MKKFSRITALAALMLSTLWVHADEPASPVPWMKVSADGAFLFKMIPEKAHWEGKLNERKVVDREAFGVAYAIENDGELKEIWRVKDWYAFDGELTRDGRYFVRHGPWATDQENHTDLAIAFYDRGKLLKEYRVKDLIKDPEKLEHSVSHYWWKPQKQTSPTGFRDYQEKDFHLVMVDKTTYLFEVATGKILETGIDADARSRTEIYAEETAEDEKKGRELYEASAFRPKYEDHFKLLKCEAFRGWTSGVHFEEHPWNGDFLTKKKYPVRCELHVAFPILDGVIRTSIEPDKILSVLDRVFAHPFVQKQFAAGNVESVSLNVTSDRLHWNTEELSKDLKILTGSETKQGDALPHWASLAIRKKDTVSNLSFYFNTETGDIIIPDWNLVDYEKSYPAWRWGILVYLDAQGKPKIKHPLDESKR